MPAQLGTSANYTDDFPINQPIFSCLKGKILTKPPKAGDEIEMLYIISLDAWQYKIRRFWMENINTLRILEGIAYFPKKIRNPRQFILSFKIIFLMSIEIILFLMCPKSSEIFFKILIEVFSLGFLYGFFCYKKYKKVTLSHSGAFGKCAGF